jgi:hypothetical protein
VPQNRLAFAFRSEWTANRNRTDCKALMSGFSVKFLRFCYLQLTDKSRLSAAKLYRGFESTTLRQQVLTAEKSPDPLPRNMEKMPVFSNICSIIWTGENGLLGSEGATGLAFLCRAHVQFGFKQGIRRMLCDHKRGIWPSRVDFCQLVGNSVRRFPYGRLSLLIRRTNR